MRNSNGKRIRDLWACSAVPQPSALLLAAQCLNQLHYCL